MTHRTTFLNLLMRIGVLVGLLCLLFAFPGDSRAQSTQPVARAVMFWMETCGHCHYILEKVFPPLQEQYGEQFEVFLIEITSAADFDLLLQTAEILGMDKNNVGVPFLIIGDRVLIGSGQIPEELPGLIETYLAQGGVDYPRLETIAALLPSPAAQAEQSGIEPGAIPAGSTAPTSPPTDALQTVQADGFAIAIAVMVGMIAALAFAVWYMGTGLQPKRTRKGKETNQATDHRWRDAAILILCLVGLGVAGYLAYVETQLVRAVCGPVGDCNAVQASPYARLFGVLPIGVLGVIGYLVILAALGVSKTRHPRFADYATLAVFGMTFFGVLFSLYLTYLEPFVIKAVCMWCVSSAVIMTLLLLLSLPAARRSLKGIRHAS